MRVWAVVREGMGGGEIQGSLRFAYSTCLRLTQGFGRDDGGWVGVSIPCSWASSLSKMMRFVGVGEISSLTDPVPDWYTTATTFLLDRARPTSLLSRDPALSRYGNRLSSPREPARSGGFPLKRTLSALSLLLLAPPLTAFAGEQLVPAGSLIQCTISEPKLSSKTADIGDPVLCRVGHVEGRSLPWGSVLVGRFEDYKDPGHLVGKGWMELKFDRMILQPDTVIPVSARVVEVPKYAVDKQGRILGKGHPVRDTVEWMIPVLWPIDLINLPRRGPRPVLKAETRLTLKVMDDFGVPTREMAREAAPLQQRQPVTYAAPAPVYAPAPAPIVYEYAAPPPPAPVMVMRRTPPPPAMLVMRNGYGMYASSYWVQGNAIRYIAANGAPVVMPMQQLDLQTTVEVNRQRGVNFRLESGY